MIHVLLVLASSAQRGKAAYRPPKEVLVLCVLCVRDVRTGVRGKASSHA